MNRKGDPNMTGFLMRGGINIDESTLDDNANYWKSGARWEFSEAEKLVNCKHALMSDPECKLERIADKFWHHDNTWKTICLKTERMLHLIKLLVKENK